MSTKPNNTAAQILSLVVVPLTVAEIATGISRSESVVRETLKTLVESGQVERSASKPFRFMAPPPKKAATPKATGPKPIDPNSGKGNPGGAVANPQPTLELKKAAARAAGGDLTYAKRVWTATAGKKTLTLTSDELAEFTIGTFCAALGVDLPPRELVAASAGARPKAA